MFPVKQLSLLPGKHMNWMKGEAIVVLRWEDEVNIVKNTINVQEI